MFGKIAAFEFRYQITNPVFWVAVVIFTLFNVLLVASPNVSIGLPSTIYENGPFGLMLASSAFSLFFMFVSTAFVANVVVRDDETGFGSIVRSTPIGKVDYLLGRFLGASAAACIAFAAVPFGIFIGSLMPWLDQESIGPNRIQDYLYAYAVIGLPNVILTSAVFFAVATMTRSMMGSYVGTVVFLVGYFIVTGTLGSKPEFEQTLAYLEPLGSGALGYATKYYTALERNTVLPPLEGAMLWNRVLALGVAAAFLALAFATFRFAQRPAKLKKVEKLMQLNDQSKSDPMGPIPPRPIVQPSRSFGTGLAQLFLRIRFELGQVLKSPGYIILLKIGVAFAVTNAVFASELFGTKTYPVTRVILQAVGGNIFLIAIVIASYYAGELVWRERDRKVHEIVDSSWAPDWVFVIPKILTITLVLWSLVVVGALSGIAVQAANGYTNFELDKWLNWYVVPEAVNYLLLAVLAVFVQVIVPHKFVGWGVMLIWMVTRMALPNLGLDHNLYEYSGAPGVPLSDMNGQGYFWIARSWFQLYWGAFAVILVVLTYGLLRRGAETRLKPRLQRLPRRLAGPWGVVAALALAVFVGSGAWIYLNTSVWNDYRSNIDQEKWIAAYEKALLPFEKVSQPTIKAVKLNVDLRPRDTRAITTGSYVLENTTGAPIPELHVRGTSPDQDIAVSVPGARLKKDYPEFNYRIYAFDTPMQPGERRAIGFQTVTGQRGFRNNGNTTSIVENGTFLNNGDIAPYIGMDRSALLQDRAKRRRYGLPSELRPPKLGTPGADRFNYLRHDSGFVLADITVTTDADQTPIAPGEKISDVTKDGRRTARFVPQAPILHFFSIQSARYAVKERTHKGVRISVYYHPEHAWNVDRMLTTAERSLDYYQANFAPYQFRQLRFIEFPAYGSFAQAFAGTMPWSENIGFITDLRDPEKIDYVTYVGAHEIGHQWWAHQVMGADEQGMTVLSETLAQYSALMVMEDIYGPDQIRKFLKYELDRYLRSRGSDIIGELPLVRVEGQQYIHYQKGSLVMYLLKDMMGEERVNAALRRVLAAHRLKGPPWPRSTVLVDALRAEAGDDQELQTLITDLFEKITIYDLKAKGATVRKRPDGRFDVTISVEAHKMYADAKGKETKAPNLDEQFDIGIFTAEPGKKDFDKSDVLMFRRMPLKDGVESLTFTVDKQPTWVGLDPYNKRIDRNSDDNLYRIGS